jgi:hypothetical protein
VAFGLLSCGAFAFERVAVMLARATALLCVAAAAATDFVNPVHSSDTPDPGVIFANKLYYAAVTGARFPILESGDMSSWTPVGFAFPKGAFPHSYLLAVVVCSGRGVPTRACVWVCCVVVCVLCACVRVCICASVVWCGVVWCGVVWCGVV